MSNTVGVLSELYPSEAPGFTSGLWWVHVVQLVWFSVLYTSFTIQQLFLN
jgi:hypothetical protein